MKIGIVTPRARPFKGGIENNTKEVSIRLARDHDVDIITCNPTGDLPSKEVIDGVNVLRFKCWAPGDAYWFSGEMDRYLSENATLYDVIHSHNYHAFPAYYVAKNKTDKVKHVFSPHFHGISGHTQFRSFLHIFYKYYGKQIFANSDAIVYCTIYERDLLLQSFGEFKDKFYHVGEGISFQRIEIPRNENDLKTIICVSRLEKYKGIQYLIRSLPFLPGFQLRVIGRGPYKLTLIELVHSLSLDHRVEFLQDLSDHELQKAYAESDVAALLSDSESYGLTVGEALAHGVPCVVANMAALHEWIEGGYCLGVDNPSNIYDVVQKIKLATGSNVNYVPPTWDEHVIKLNDLYRKVLLMKNIRS